MGSSLSRVPSSSKVQDLAGVSSSGGASVESALVAHESVAAALWVAAAAEDFEHAAALRDEGVGKLLAPGQFVPAAGHRLLHLRPEHLDALGHLDRQEEGVDAGSAEILGLEQRVADRQPYVLLSTASLIGEGFDLPALDTLFLTMPLSFKGRLVQYAGRLHRSHAEKSEVWRALRRDPELYKDAWAYIRERELPYNALHDRGYASIGDTHSTLPGDGREGRWAGSDRTECGLHPS